MTDRADSVGKTWASTATVTGQTLRVGILLWPSFPLMSLAGIVESLRHAGDHGDDSNPRYARWDILGASGGVMRSSCGLPVSSTAGYGYAGTYDHLFVIGGLLRDLDHAPQAHIDYMMAAVRHGVPVYGVCTGSFVLARAGLLDGKPVCIHPYHRDHFESAFPGHRFVPNREYHSAGNVVTVLGGVAILSLMKLLISQHLGPDRAAKVKHQMTLPASDTGPDQHAVASGPSPEIHDARIQRALVMLDAQAAQNPAISDLAHRLGLSERHFLRLFREHVGCSPKEYMIDTKLRAAIWMLRHTGQSITAIAYSAGFSSGASLADHCRRRLKTTPGDIRRQAMARAAFNSQATVMPPDDPPPPPFATRSRAR